MTAPRRVLLAVDSAAGTTTLEVSIRLARAAQLEVHAVFVESARALQAAELPFARALAHPGAGWQPLARDDIEAAFRAQLALLRRRLQALAAAHEVPLTLDVVRGPFPAAALSLLQPADLLLVATAAAGVPLAPARTLWVDYDGSPAARDALAIAQRAADTLRARLHVMLHGKDVPTCARLRAQAQAALGPAARAARIDTAYPASALLRIAPRELLDDDALARYEGAVLLVG